MTKNNDLEDELNNENLDFLEEEHAPSASCVVLRDSVGNLQIVLQELAGLS